jgi:hypothetical protein
MWKICAVITSNTSCWADSTLMKQILAILMMGCFGLLIHFSRTAEIVVLATLGYIISRSKSLFSMGTTNIDVFTINLYYQSMCFDIQGPILIDGLQRYLVNYFFINK